MIIALCKKITILKLKPIILKVHTACIRVAIKKSMFYTGCICGIC